MATNENQILEALLASFDEDDRASDSFHINQDSSFPFSSDCLKSATPVLSKKGEPVGKALTKAVDDGRGKVFDLNFGIRVKNPKITSSTLSTYCSGFIKIRPSHLKRQSVPKTDWFTMGVIVEKSEFRKSANGNEYMIWKISDLKQFQDTPVKVLLFGECVKEHWKLQESAVVALITPQLADSADDKGITLKLTKSAQVIDIGFCPDFGHCKAVKQNGVKCTQHVNTSSSEYCVYHIQKAAKTTLVNRAALSSQFNSPIGCRVAKRKLAVVNGETKVVGNTHTFLNASKSEYPGDTVKPKVSTKTISSSELIALKEQENDKLSDIVKRSRVSFGARNLIKHRTSKNDIVKNAASKPMPKAPVDVKAFLRKQKMEMEKAKMVEDDSYCR